MNCLKCKSASVCKHADQIKSIKNGSFLIGREYSCLCEGFVIVFSSATFTQEELNSPTFSEDFEDDISIRCIPCNEKLRNHIKKIKDSNDKNITD